MDDAETHPGGFQPGTITDSSTDGGVVDHKMAEADDDEIADSRDTQCGIGSCRPQFARPLGSMWAFTAAMSISTIVANMNFTYYSAVITQIERRFGLSSAMTGFIKNVDNIGFICTVLAVSHLGRHANKSRILATSSFLSGLAIFLFAVPHLMYGGPSSAPIANETVWNVTDTSGGMYRVCLAADKDAVNASASAGAGHCDSSGRQGFALDADAYTGAVALFVLSELMQGMAISPKTALTVTYLDDNAKDKSPQHVGIMFAMRAFAPMIGFLMGAWTNRIYVDLSQPDISQKDPRWIGAWWVGFVICGVCTCVWALPLALFPKRLTGAKSPPAAKRPENEHLINRLKDMPKSVWRLCMNPVYMCCLLGTSCNVTLMGFTTFLPKYYESYFGVTPSMASVYTGIVSAISWGIGTIISGPIVSRMKITISRLLTFVVVIHVVAVVGYSITLFLDCPEAEWAGTHGSSIGFRAAMSCNANCTCDPTAYSPVCGSDGRNYFSPCYAGCRNANETSSKKIFFDCQCIDGGQATMGLCERHCSNLSLYIVIIFITFFFTSLMMIPVMMVKMRCVEDRDKAMSLALSSFVMQIASFPAPILYGRVIDSVCVVQQQMTCNRKGACLLYDHDSFRWKLHILAVVAKFGAMSFYLLGLIVRRRRLSAAVGNGAVDLNDIKASNELKSIGSNDKKIKESTAIDANRNEHATDSPTHSMYETRF